MNWISCLLDVEQMEVVFTEVKCGFVVIFDNLDEVEIWTLELFVCVSVLIIDIVVLLVRVEKSLDYLN